VARHCWTCNTDHDPDEACRRSASPGSDRDLFDDAPAAPQESKLGPVSTATHGGEDDCCGEGIEPGDRIRADGHGGWIHEGCEEE
jgi:hypothetical protein